MLGLVVLPSAIWVCGVVRHFARGVVGVFGILRVDRGVGGGGVETVRVHKKRVVCVQWGKRIFAVELLKFFCFLS